MADKLSVYNAALRELGQSRLAALTENREDRRVLDDVYQDVIEEALEGGQWNHGTRDVEIYSETGVDLAFGFNYAFSKPDDWVRTTGLSASPDGEALRQVKDGAGFWFANVEPIYVSYVSKDAAYGGNISLWPPSFRRYVVLMMAERACARIIESEAKQERILKKLKAAKADAASTDAMNQPPQDLPRGAWVSARGGTWRGERGLG